MNLKLSDFFSKKLFIIPAFLGTLCRFCCAEGGVIATVEEQEISKEAVYSAATRGAYDLTNLESAKKAVEDVITFELLFAEGKRLGYDQDSEVIKQIKRLIVQKLVGEKIEKELPKVVATEEELEAYYDSHPDEFTKSSMVKGQLITVLVTEGKEKEAENKIQAALKLLNEGTSFYDVVKSHSDDSAGQATGGMTDWIIQDKENKQYPQEIIDILVSGNDRNKIYGPIRIDKTFYLVKLAEKRPRRIITYKRAKNGISSKIYREARQKAYSEYCNQLKSQFAVQINEDQLENLVQEAKKNKDLP